MLDCKIHYMIWLKSNGFVKYRGEGQIKKTVSTRKLKICLFFSFILARLSKVCKFSGSYCSINIFKGAAFDLCALEVRKHTYISIRNIHTSSKFDLFLRFLTLSDLMWPRYLFFEKLTTRASFWSSIYKLSRDLPELRNLTQNEPKFVIWPKFFNRNYFHIPLIILS